MSITPNQRDAHLLMTLADSGRPVEIVAQFIASYIESAGMSSVDALSEIISIAERVIHLIDHQELIWPELMPGPGGSEADELTVVSTLEVAKLLLDQAHLQQQIEILGQDKQPEELLQEYFDYLIANKLIESDVDNLIHLTIVSTTLVEDGMLAVDKTGQLGLIMSPFFANFTNPDDGEVEPGHNVGVDPMNWKPLDASEVHGLLN